ncbi:MAG: hypothetical protein E7000_01405 [Coriobacteriaceae bacterium]|nr:hypothetical protein [Coriobacteriaceae bacterium]
MPAALAALIALVFMLALGNSPEHAYGSEQSPSAAAPHAGVVKSSADLKYYYEVTAKPVKITNVQVKHDGFVVAGNKLYYFKGESEVPVRNKTVQGIRFGRSGAAVDNYTTKLKIAAMKTAKKLRLYDTSVGKNKRLKKAFSYCCNKSTIRYSTIYPTLDREGMHRVGYIMLTKHRGCCYGFASAFGALAKEIGYNPKIVCLKRPHHRHGVCKIDGKYYDASYAHHKVKNKWSVFDISWKKEAKITHYSKKWIKKKFDLYEK